MNGMGWFFLKIDEFERGKSNYNITKKKTLALGRKLGSITGDGAAATSQK